MKTKINFLMMGAILLLCAVRTEAQTKWNLDNSHTNVKFTVTHMVISEVDGYFKTFSGSMTSSKPDFTDATIEFTVNVASINTDNEQRDGHLKADDFFNAEKYPVMTFKSISMKKLSGNRYELTGDLTIRDITKQVKFAVTYGGTAKDPWGNTKAGFKASTSINRFDYGLKWNTLMEAGGAMVGQDVTISINAEFAQAK
jgi:polyisoprenoid-binding protein YceI